MGIMVWGSIPVILSVLILLLIYISQQKQLKKERDEQINSLQQTLTELQDK
jgi:preprotein translocase subunit YajC